MAVISGTNEDSVDVAARIPLAIEGYKTRRKIKPNNCKCPEQNIWKIKQVL